METDDNYDDIINLPHHQSATRAHMSNYNRAAQFSPFAALTGYDAAVKETARLTDSRIELDEYELDLLNEKLNKLQDNLHNQHQSKLQDDPAGEPEVSITYFVADQKKAGGSYTTITGTVKRIEDYEQLIIMSDGTKISIADMLEIEGDVFKSQEGE